MANFEVKIVRIDSVEPHPQADRLTINRVGGYCAITNLGEDGTPRFATGDLAVYVPENAVIPEDVLKQYGYWDDAKGKGLLGGKAGNRIRPVRLRNVYSEGLLFPVLRDYPNGISYGQGCVTRGDQEQFVNPGDDVADFLSIQKYEPPIPASMAGQCFAVDGLPRYDIEAYEKHVGVLVPGELVVATEKIHGTFTGFSYMPERACSDAPDGLFVFSKGLGAKGLTFKHVPENDGNLYMRMYRELFGLDKMDADRRLLKRLAAYEMPVHLFGETFGPGVQDLHYGEKKPTFRLFDIYLGEWGKGAFVVHSYMISEAKFMGIPTVPVLYEGPFDVAALEAVRDGKDSLSGTNVREGIVVKSLIERRVDGLGRVCLKMVSPTFKLRKGGGEELS